jgi:hypothetical protein
VEAFLLHGGTPISWKVHRMSKGSVPAASGAGAAKMKLSSDREGRAGFFLNLFISRMVVGNQEKKYNNFRRCYEQPTDALRLFNETAAAEMAKGHLYRKISVDQVDTAVGFTSSSFGPAFEKINAFCHTMLMQRK